MSPDTRPAIETGCELVEWDSEFFGCRIARIESCRVETLGMRGVEEWCTNQRIDCAYLLIDAEDQSICAIAEAHGFRLVDVRVTLETVARPSPPEVRRPDGPVVRPAGAGDVEALEAIARESHRATRFYNDGHFDHRRCDQLYELWIGKSCQGWADRVFVAEVDGFVAGYLTCHLRNGAGRIGLLAVTAVSRGRGAGSALLNSATGWFAEQGAQPVSVVTQARNGEALRFYQRAGMSVRAIQLWFHKWW